MTAKKELYYPNIVKTIEYKNSNQKKGELKMNWHYMDTEGRPKKAGTYWVTLIFDTWGNKKEASKNKKSTMIDTRYFCDAKAENLLSWVMNNEPKEGLVWTQKSGSMPNEQVYAWAEIEEIPFPERLPNNITKWAYNE